MVCVQSSVCTQLFNNNLLDRINSVPEYGDRLLERDDLSRRLVGFVRVHVVEQFVENVAQHAKLFPERLRQDVQRRFQDHQLKWRSLHATPHH